MAFLLLLGCTQVEKNKLIKTLGVDTGSGVKSVKSVKK
jgi:hypothetical protein